MPGQALFGIMPTHTFGRANMYQECELITQAQLSPLSLPASQGGSLPVSVPGCTYRSRALAKACLGIPGSVPPSPHPGCSLLSLAGRAELWGKLGRRVAAAHLCLSPAPVGLAPSWCQLSAGDRLGCKSLADRAEQNWGMLGCWGSAAQLPEEGWYLWRACMAVGSWQLMWEREDLDQPFSDEE